MDYLLPKLLKSNRTSPSYFKRCNYIKHDHEVSKRIQPNLAKKYTKSGKVVNLKALHP